MRPNELDAYGWTPDLERAFLTLESGSAVPARVVQTQRGLHRIVTSSRIVSAEVAGSLRHTNTGAPVVGDWVAAEVPDTSDGAVIQAVVPRRSQIVRKAPGRPTGQVLAANVDTVFIVTSCNEDLSPRRIERYLTLVWDGGATPVVVVNKADLVDDPQNSLTIAAGAATGVAVLGISARTAAGLDPLDAYLRRGQTIALLGSSGVGKSTIVNRLMGRAVQAVRATREEDAKGRHTTTSRELFVLPSGAILVDTPGLREVGLWVSDTGLERAFPEVDEFARHCRFDDCGHDHEPGCAVRASVERGELAADRLDGYLRLRRELEHLERQRNPAQQAGQKQRWKTIHKSVRDARRRGWIR